MMNFMLPAGLVLATATQLRFPGAPLGLGEILLTLWAGLAWPRIFKQGPLGIPAPVRPFAYFFIAVIVILSIANVGQAQRLQGMHEYAIRDTIAYLFIAVTMVTFGLTRIPIAVAADMLRWIVIFGVALFGLLLLLSAHVRQIGPLILATGPRFVGLSENPNQLGMLFTPMPFLCLYFFRQASTFARRCGFGLLLLLSIGVGLGTASDALVVGWAGGAIMLVLTAALLKAQRYLIGGSIPLNQIMIMTNVMLLCLGLALLVISSSSFRGKVEDVIAAVESGDEGHHRPLMWARGVATLANSPIVGLGGGPQVIDMTFAVPREAHNSYIDFTLSTGLLGLTCLLAMLWTVLFRSQLLLQPALFAALAALLSFSFFHYIFRHPVFWFFLALIAVVGYGERLARRAAAVSVAARPPSVEAVRLRSRTAA